MLRFCLRHLALLGCASVWQVLHLPITLAEESVAATAEIAPALSLADASRWALEKHPQLTARRAVADAQRAAADQAANLPNPVLSWNRENLDNDALTGTDGPADTIAISQLIELGGKRGGRIAIAESELMLRELDWRQSRANVLAEVRIRYADVALSQSRVEALAELVQISEQTAHAARERVRAGKVAPIEQTRAAITLSTIRGQQAQAGRELVVARARLALLWGDSAASFSSLTDTPERLLALPDVAQLQRQLANSPRWQQADALLSLRTAERDFADAKAIPDLTFSFGRTEYGDLDETSDAVGVSLQLPLFDRNQGGKAAAMALQMAARDEQRGTQQQLQAELQALHQGLLGTQQEIDVLNNEVVPGAETVLQGALTAYHAGKFGLLEVLDAQRLLFDSRSQQLRSLQQFHHRLAELERLLGLSLADMPATQE